MGVYDRSIPDPGPSPKMDAGKMQTNFDIYNGVFSVNHVQMNAYNQGSHKAVQFLQQQFGPGNVQSEVALFNKLAPVGAAQDDQLFIKIPKFLPTKNDTRDIENFSMQLTFNRINIAGPIYQSFLPGIGIYLVYIGSGSGVTAGANVNTLDTITLTGASQPTQIVCAQATATSKRSNNNPMNITTNITGSNTFDVITNGNNSNTNVPYSFTWIAIGIVS